MQYSNLPVIMLYIFKSLRIGVHSLLDICIFFSSIPDSQASRHCFLKIASRRCCPENKILLLEFKVQKRSDSCCHLPGTRISLGKCGLVHSAHSISKGIIICIPMLLVSVNEYTPHFCVCVPYQAAWRTSWAILLSPFPLKGEER